MSETVSSLVAVSFDRTIRNAENGLRSFSKKTEPAWVVLPLIFIGYGFFASTHRPWDATSVAATIGSAAILLLMAFVIASQVIRGTMSIRHIAVSALSMLLLLIFDAAIVYYSIGARGNWNMKLSHVDAMLVSVGTLTTAGTGGISPRSELARGLMLGQMVADFVVVTVAVGFVLQRVVSPKMSAGAEPASDQSDA
jgi:hypothetical protein